MKNKVKFTHVTLGKEWDIAIAHIYKMSNPEQIHEYAVVRYPDLDINSKHYGTWGHSLGYYETYEQALDKFNDYIGKQIAGDIGL